jgi:hypothetical protein
METRDVVKFMYAQGYYPNWDNGLILRAKTINELYLGYLIFTQKDPLCFFPRLRFRKILKDLGYSRVGYVDSFYVYTK